HMQSICLFLFFFQAEDGIRDRNVTGVQTCALPISTRARHPQILQITQARLPPNPAHLRAIAQVAPTLIRATASASALLPLPQPRRPQVSPGPSAPQIAHLQATAWAQMVKVTSGTAPASPNRP